MRTMHKATAIVAALGIAFGVTACGTDTDSTPVAESTPKASATTTSGAPGLTAPGTVDQSLRKDLEYMATAQEIWLTDTPPKNPQGYGFAVTATKPGGTVQLSTNNVFHASVGNVVTVKVAKAGYCISVYNQVATTATSATKSLLYKSDKGGLQAGVGAC